MSSTDTTTDAQQQAVTLDAAAIAELCHRVAGAQRSAVPIAKLTNDYPGMTVADGYAIQMALKRQFLADGERLVGWKAGLTSKAKMRQMGVDKPSIGFLTDAMARPENSAIHTHDLVHPRVECEVAFVTKAPLSGPDCTAAAVMAATDYVIPAIEVIDSRYENFKFDLQSVIADNSSSARFIAGGRPRRADDLDLCTLGVVLEKNGEIVEMGASAEVLGDPAEAVAMLVNQLHQLGEALPAGSFVMSGGITAAVAVQPGDNVNARFQELGSISIRFVE